MAAAAVRPGSYGGASDGRQAGGWAHVRRWDWSLKTSPLAQPGVVCLGTESGGEMQGMALVKTLGPTARSGPDKGKPLVNADVLEAAPWNTESAGDRRGYVDVGLGLLDAVVHLSRDPGYDGRAGLHSSPRSEGFYRHGAEMPDAGYHWLVYFEFPAAGAANDSPEA